jgi:hypothetical protein
MEPKQVEKERMLLTTIIKDGTRLRQELSMMFDESARNLLTPATNDLRTAGATVMEDLRQWRLAADALLARMEPATQALMGSAQEVRSAAAAVVKEGQETLNTLSQAGMAEARRSVTELREELRSLLAEFLDRNGAAYLAFENASREFLAMQRQQTDDTRAGLAIVQEELANLNSTNAAGLQQLSQAVADHSVENRSGIKDVREGIQSARASIEAAVHADRDRLLGSHAELGYSLSTLAIEKHQAQAANIAEAEARLSRSIATELEQTRKRLDLMETAMRGSVQEVANNLHALFAATEAREKAAARQATLRFWILIGAIVAATAALSLLIRR